MPPATTDRPARVTVARYAPLAFLVAKVTFMAIFAYSWFINDTVDAMAGVLAFAMLPPLVITWMNRETVRTILSENADLKRDLRSLERLSL